MSILDKDTYKKVEWHLYNYFQLRREVQEYEEDILESGAQEHGESGSGRSWHSDPTACKVLRLVSPDMLQKQKWLKVVRKVLMKFDGTDKGRLIEKKYFEELGEVHVCMELHISRATFFNWREEIVLFTALLAVQEKLIKISNIA